MIANYIKLKKKIMEEEVLDLVMATLEKAKVYGLEVEVISSAFIALKNNSKICITEALDTGLNEWVK